MWTFSPKHNDASQEDENKCQHIKVEEFKLTDTGFFRRDSDKDEKDGEDMDGTYDNNDTDEKDDSDDKDNSDDCEAEDSMDDTVIINDDDGMDGNGSPSEE